MAPPPHLRAGPTQTLLGSLPWLPGPSRVACLSASVLKWPCFSSFPQSCPDLEFVADLTSFVKFDLLRLCSGNMFRSKLSSSSSSFMWTQKNLELLRALCVSARHSTRRSPVFPKAPLKMLCCATAIRITTALLQCVLSRSMSSMARFTLRRSQARLHSCERAKLRSCLTTMMTVCSGCRALCAVSTWIVPGRALLAPLCSSGVPSGIEIVSTRRH